MRLLRRNSADQLCLTQDFVSNDIPAYAILSHTWGADTEEVTFQDLMNGTNEDKSGYEKISFCEKQARRDGLLYFWVDTCCIDKSNSTELAEAINSMFRWYRNSARCYVYLSDVSTNDHIQVGSSLQLWQSDFQKSRWFTRGWTLQELIAPATVEFFCSNHRRLGDKKSLERQLHEITGIAIPALRGSTLLSEFSVEERMSWAKNRNTKREEDKVYSLLGIFEVYVPLIYGEGVDNAFSRLYDELSKRSKKDWHEEPLSISMATSKSTKKLKTSRHQSSSFPPNCDVNIVDTESLSHSKDSTPINDTTKQASKEQALKEQNLIRKSLMDQLYFDKIDERLTSLTAAQGTTCRWFLTTLEYISWHDPARHSEHGGFLWIKGHPGTGKSTLMKFLFEDARLKAEDNSSQITLSFFFLARGTIEEKSILGLYRSLLHQLFQKAVETKDSLNWMTPDGARGIERNGWHKEALKQTLAYAIQKLGNRSLTIFVDALDECDMNQVSDMICFFEELCDLAEAAQVRLQICFSSRHYPTVVIQKGIEVILEKEIGHTEDIKHYIKSKLRLGKSKQAESLRSEILQKSSNIFLWVVLVLNIFNSEYPSSSLSINKVRERLKDIPSKLIDLFEMILTRDGENLEQLQICLKWILFATRSLKPQELYFAIQLGINKCSSSFWDQEDVDLDQMKTFVLSSSKGLAEVTRNQASEVQFIHESVRDFLLGKYGGRWCGVSGNFVGDSHETLKNCCLAQLSASICEHIDIPDPLPKVSDAVQLRETIFLKFPFLEYSVLNILHHANSAQQNAIEQEDFLAGFPLQQWISFNNILETYDIRRYTKLASILYILAEKNLPDLIRIHPQKMLCFDVGSERYGPPIFAALASLEKETVQAIFEIEAEAQPTTSVLYSLCKRYYHDENNRIHFGPGFEFDRQMTILQYAVSDNDEILAAFFLASRSYMPDSRDEFGQKPLSRAAALGNVGIVKLLIDKCNVALNFEDENGRTPLSLAAMNGHIGVAKLLLDISDVALNSKDENGRTPLSSASENGHAGVVKLLLNVRGVNVNSQDKSCKTPLLQAVINKHEDVVKLFLDTSNIDINAKTKFGLTILAWAAEMRNNTMVKLLLETGKAKIVSENDRSNQILLSWAAENGHKTIFKSLLDTNMVDVNSKDNKYGRTPLCWAALNGYEDMVKFLLDTNMTDVNSKDSKYGRTPLCWAALNGHEDVFKLLLDTNKMDIDSKDNNDGQTPLCLAALNGHKNVVKFLLDTNMTNINSKDDRYGRTPLCWAALNGHEDVIKLLLGTNKIDINARDDSKGATPLWWAFINRHKGIAKLLRERGATI